MIVEKGQTQWLCLGESVRGASHQRTGLPNQDAISWWPKKAESPHLGEGPPLFLAVSDGHGSSKSFRSQIGSELAVKAAERVILGDESDEVKNFLTIKLHQDIPQNSSSQIDRWKQFKDIAQNSLPKKIVHEWKQFVKEHWTENTVTEQEWERLIEKDGIAVRQAIEGEWEGIMQQKDSPTAQQDLEHNYPAAYGVYGATLLAVLVTDSFILYLQIGDGDILCVDSSGKTTRPLERDSRLIANETTSLCTINAWREFQVALISYQESTADRMPVLILVATDGYANSFPSEAEFIKIGRDYREMTRQNGITYVGQQLKGFLQDTSERGSGDDITLGIIRRVELGDRDSLDERLTAIEEELADQRDIMTIQQEKIADVETGSESLSERQKKMDKTLLLLLSGLIVTFSLALMGTSFSAWLFFRLNQVDSELENQQVRLQEIEEQIKSITAKPQNSREAEKSSPTSEQDKPDATALDNSNSGSEKINSPADSETTEN